MLLAFDKKNLPFNDCKLFAAISLACLPTCQTKKGDKNWFFRKVGLMYFNFF